MLEDAVFIACPEIKTLRLNVMFSGHFHCIQLIFREMVDEKNLCKAAFSQFAQVVERRNTGYSY